MERNLNHLSRIQQLMIHNRLVYPVNEIIQRDPIYDLFYFCMFQDCSFNKLQSDTAIKVSFQGNMRVYGNGNECSGPMTIEAAVYNGWPSSAGNPNLYHHRSFEGYCKNIPQGTVTVELWVGSCPSGHRLGDAYTGWKSVSRIIIEEVSRPQS